MSKSIRAQGGHLVFPIGPKNTYLVEDDEILLSIKFHWIPFSGFWEVENVSANQRPGGSSCFFDRLEKRKLGRECWDLTFCQVSLNSVERFQRRSRKCLNQSPGRPSCFSDRTEKHKLGWGRWDLALLSFVEFCSTVSEKSKMSQPIRGQGGDLVFSDRPEKHKLG